MTSADAPPNQPNAQEVSLEDIDKLLEAEDPEFTKQLEEVRSVEVDKSIVLEASVTDDDDSLGDGVQTEDKPESRIQRFRTGLRNWLLSVRVRLKARSATFSKDLVIFLKTRPKEFALFAVAILLATAKKSVGPIQTFRLASGLQKLTIVTLIAMSVGALWVLKSNVKGIWLPQLNEPLLTSFEDFADSVESYSVKDGGESFYSAFPQERHEFLFRKMKVNLKRDNEHLNPMGAFEVIVQVDSKDTAIELRDREVEFFDYLQRVFEDESFGDLETEIGKNKLKARLKRELNQKLTQGWVKDIAFKTFVLKP